MWINRSRILFVSCLLIAGAILVQMGMYALHIFFNREISFNILQVCNNWLKSLGFRPIGFFLGGLVIYTFGMFTWLLGKQLLMSHLMHRKLLKAQQNINTYEMYQLRLTEVPGIHIFSSPQPMAFTMGFLKPRVFLSTGLLSLLDKHEIKAVIYHELQHKKSADPLNMFIFSVCATVFWYVPLLKWLLNQYKIAREIVADQYAINQMGSSIQLGSALLKLLKKDHNFSMPFTYASFADTSVNYRIKQILEPHTTMSLKPPLPSTLVSLHILLLISALYLFHLY